MNKFSTTNIIAGNKKVDLMAKDRSNKYLFNKVDSKAFIAEYAQHEPVVLLR